jgi:NifC-like ABC-type porter
MTPAFPSGGARPVPSRAARTPLALAVPALAAVAFLLVPLAGVLLRTPWAELGTHLTAPPVTGALRISLVVSFWSLGLSLLLGVPLAWLLARGTFRGKALVRSLVLLPMVLPPTVGGVALLSAFGRRGLLGPWLEGTFGVVLPFHTSGAVAAATFVSMPFLVISLEGAFAGLRPGYEETAACLGAGPLRVFRTVTLPLAAPALAAGAALTWARALGEFGATITFAGNLPGTTQTLPLQVYLLLQDEPEAATAVSLLLLATAMAVLVALRGRWTGGGRTEVRGSAHEAGAPRGTRRATLRAPAADEDPGAGCGDGRSDAAPAGPPPARERWSLHADVSGATTVALEAEPGTTIAVVGPNGAGKTTLLRALLGLTPRALAHVRLGGTDVTALPPHRRRAAWVPQDGALFPHLTALANTAYGLRAQGVPRVEARRTARQWLDRLGVGGLAGRRPAQLSGGQAQRVALARALAVRPRLLLLDEPLAALDQTTRAEVRHTLRKHLSAYGGVCLLVTHDPVEAVALAGRVLVLEEGRTVQDAPPAEVTRHPRSPWVARMLGRNAWPGTATHDGLRLTGGGHLVAAEPVASPPGGTATGSAALAVISPEAVSLHRERPSGSPRNVWPGMVKEMTAVGSRIRVLVDCEGAPGLVCEVTPAAAAELELRDGTAVFASVKATEVTLVGT